MQRDEVLAEAEKCICGDRDKTYGGPENNFSTIAKFWSAYLDIEVEPKDVGIMMALFKCARIKAGGSYVDSYIDLCGYGACAAEVATEKQEK